MALNSLARAEDQRAIPMLEKIVNGTGSPRLKERALYVLAQNGSPEARQIVIRIARGGNPDLQARAVQHLGAFGGPESKQALLDIFKSTNNVTVKRNILRSFQSTGDRAQLLEVARTEPLPELRAEAVQQLGSMGAQEQLMQLYSTEKTIEVRRRIIQAMFQRHNPDVLIQLLKTETEPELRRSIVQNLGQMGSAQGTAALQSLYASEKDEAVKRAVIDAFANQRNAKVLIELGRKETDPAMKRRIVERLGQMKIARSDRLLHGNPGAAMKTAAFVLAGVFAAIHGVRAAAQLRQRARGRTGGAARRRACDSGDRESASRAGMDWICGAGVEQRLVRPRRWVERAVQAGTTARRPRDERAGAGPDSARAGSEPDGAGAPADE